MEYQGYIYILDPKARRLNRQHSCVVRIVQIERESGLQRCVLRGG